MFWTHLDSLKFINFFSYQCISQLCKLCHLEIQSPVEWVQWHVSCWKQNWLLIFRFFFVALSGLCHKFINFFSYQCTLLRFPNLRRRGWTSNNFESSILRKRKVKVRHWEMQLKINLMFFSNPKNAQFSTHIAMHILMY